MHMMHLQLKCWAITFLITSLTIDRWRRIINDFKISCCNAKELCKNQDDTFALVYTCAIIPTCCRWNHCIPVARLIIIIIIIVYQVFMQIGKSQFCLIAKNKRAYNLDLHLAKSMKYYTAAWDQQCFSSYRVRITDWTIYKNSTFDM